MACIRLTESQRQVMDLLWDSGESFTSTEIVERCPDRTWKETYIHILINSMLKKGVIEVSGFVQTTKNYARTFRAAISREEYMLHQMIGPYTPERLMGVFHSLLAVADEPTRQKMANAVQKYL